MRPHFVALCCALLACDPKDPADDTGGSAVDCAAVAPADCAATAGCEAYSARPFQDDGAGGVCVDFSEATVPVACQDADTGHACGDAETPASADSDPDTLYLFNNTCIPDGWSVIGDYGEYSECP